MKKESSIANMIALAIEKVREKLAYCPVFPNTHSSAYFTHRISEMTYKTLHPGVLRTHTFFTLCVKKKQRTYIILEPRVPDKLFFSELPSTQDL